jgi:hypothetical protein
MPATRRKVSGLRRPEKGHETDKPWVLSDWSHLSQGKPTPKKKDGPRRKITGTSELGLENQMASARRFKGRPRISEIFQHRGFPGIINGFKTCRVSQMQYTSDVRPYNQIQRSIIDSHLSSPKNFNTPEPFSRFYSPANRRITMYVVDPIKRTTEEKGGTSVKDG